MSDDNRCRSCGDLLMQGALGLCPICLLRSGQAESNTGPFMSGTSTAAGTLLQSGQDAWRHSSRLVARLRAE